MITRPITRSITRAITRSINGSSVVTPVTDGMTLTASWVARGTAYATLDSTTAASVRVDATISNTDSGVLMESGATGTGVILYVYAGVLYFQCGDGSSFGAASDRAEIAYTLPGGEFGYIVEWSANDSNGVLYINGTKIGADAYSATNVSGGDAGTIGEVSQSVAVNRGGWTSNGEGSYTNTISKCDVFNGQVTSDV